MKKLGVFIPILLAIVLAFSMVPSAYASSAIIYGDSTDGWVNSTGAYSSGVQVFWIGDTENNGYTQALVKFSLSGVPETITSATLYVYLYLSLVNDISDYTSPLSNPDLGNCIVRHIDDFGSLSFADLDSPSIGNDPGILIGSIATPDVGYLSIDVTAAMQDDIDNGRSYASFLIKMSANTDGDSVADQWNFYSSDKSGTDQDPYIEYTFAGPVGGIYASSDKLSILAPYITLVGFIGVVSTIFAVRRWRKD